MKRGDEGSKALFTQDLFVLTDISFAQFDLLPGYFSLHSRTLSGSTGARSTAGPPDF